MAEDVWPVYTWQWSELYYCLETTLQNGEGTLSQSDFPDTVLPEDVYTYDSDGNKYYVGNCFDCSSSKVQDDKLFDAFDSSNYFFGSGEHCGIEDMRDGAGNHGCSVSVGRVEYTYGIPLQGEDLVNAAREGKPSVEIKTRIFRVYECSGN